MFIAPNRYRLQSICQRDWSDFIIIELSNKIENFTVVSFVIVIYCIPFNGWGMFLIKAESLLPLTRVKRIDGGSLLRSTLLALLLTPILAAFFVVLLASSLALPDKPIIDHIAEDAALFEHPRIHSFSGRKIDVGTECIGVSYGIGDAASAPPIEAAVRSPVIFECAALLAFVDLGDQTGAGDYTNYWHGYAAISRPLLALFPYHDVRMLTFYTMVILFGLLAFGLTQSADARVALAALLPFFFVNYSGFFELWTKAASWIVMLVTANIIVRTNWTSDRRPYILFYFAGAATAFVDLLTTPLLVLGYPAALYFLMALKEEGPVSGREQSMRLALISVFWTIGFAGIWLMKPAMAAVILGPDAWVEFAKAATFRLNGSYDSVKHFIGAATLENFEAFKGLWGGLAIITFFIAPFMRRGGRTRLASLFQTAPALMLLALSPFVWFEVVSNHSQIHGLFTHTNLVLTFLPFSLVLLKAESSALSYAGNLSRLDPTPPKSCATD